MKLKRQFMMTIAMTAVMGLGLQACFDGGQAGSLEDDAVLAKFADWHIGFATNAEQRDADLAANVAPRWGLSELRFKRIWPDREDGYWIYYETSQPDVRPDRNQIWRLYRNASGALKVDTYNFNDTEAGLALWGKNGDDAAFESITQDELTTIPGCNSTYAWREEFDRFVGTNVHESCYTIGKSYLLQHVEISKTETGSLVRKDWHTFYDENGVAKQGAIYKVGTHGPTTHIYTERYELN